MPTNEAYASLKTHLGTEQLFRTYSDSAPFANLKRKNDETRAQGGCAGKEPVPTAGG